MKFSEIERLYSQKVAEFLVQGYTIDVKGTRCYGREVGKVDLRNEDSVVRVAVEYRYARTKEDEDQFSIYFHNRILIRVSKMACPRIDNEKYNSVEYYPDSAFTVVEETEWVCLSDSWFVTIEEARSLLEKKKYRAQLDFVRYLTNKVMIGKFDLLVKIARKYKGLKTVKFGDVIGYKVYKPYHDWDGDHESGYYIRAKNKEIKIL